MGSGLATLFMFKAQAAASLKITEDADEDIDEAIGKISKAIKSECAGAKPKLDSYSVHIDRYSAD